MNSEQLKEVPIDWIDAEPQVRERFEEGPLTELSAQIKRHGLLQPIVVRRAGSRFKLVFGGRRFLAAKMAGCRTIAARIIDGELDEGETVLQQLIENCHEALAPLEWAKGIARLMAAKKMTASQTAAELGFSETRVSNALALLKLPKPIQELVEKGAIAPSAASRLAGIEDSQQQAELAQRLAEGKLTRDGLCGAIRAARKVSATQGQPAARRVTAVLDGKRSVTVSGASDLEGFIQTLEELAAKARKARPRGIGLSTFIKILRDEAKA